MVLNLQKKIFEAMKKSVVTLLLGALAVMAAHAQVPVFLTAGQSNTDGRVPAEDIPSYITENKYKYCRWSYCNGVRDTVQGEFELYYPRMSSSINPNRWTYDAVAYYFIEQALQRPFYVIKQSYGGTSIDPTCKSSGRKGAPGDGFHWSADSTFLADNESANKGGNSLLKAFTGNIGECIDRQLSQLPEGYEIKAWMWHQGESDCHAPEHYYANIKAMVAYVRNYLVEKTGRKEYAHLPFICGTVPSSSRDYRAMIEEALYQLQQEDKDFHVISLKDAQLQADRLHFTAAPAEKFGKEVYNLLVDEKIIDGKPVSLDFGSTAWK